MDNSCLGYKEREMIRTFHELEIDHDTKKTCSEQESRKQKQIHLSVLITGMHLDIYQHVFIFFQEYDHGLGGKGQHKSTIIHLFFYFVYMFQLV